MGLQGVWAGHVLGHPLGAESGVVVTVTSVNTRPHGAALLRCQLLMLAAALLIGTSGRRGVVWGP